MYQIALQDLSSKLYLCHYKGDLPTAAHRGDFIAVSPCESIIEVSTH